MENADFAGDDTITEEDEERLNKTSQISEVKLDECSGAVINEDL